MEKILLRLELILLLMCFICLLACGKVEEKQRPASGKKIFIDVTGEAGLSYIRDSFSHCWSDIDNDGFLDLFVINHLHHPPSLFRNNGDGTFADITLDSGLNKGGDPHGCAISDYDNDGTMDIYVTVGGEVGKGLGPNRLYKNNGEGKFVDIADKAGVDYPKGRGRSVSWVDYNNDGLLDLFIANAKRENVPSVLFRNNGDGTFTDVSIESRLNIVDNAGRSAWIDYNNDGFMDLTILRASEHEKHSIELYANIKGKRFEKIRTFYGWAYAWGDYDNDGDMDIIVTVPPRYYLFNNKYEFTILPEVFRGFNRLYENVGGDKFVDATDPSGLKKMRGGDQLILFDFDNDGDLDIYLLVSGTRSKNINDILLQNNGDKTFTDITEKTGLVQRFTGRGCGVAYADFNNDGFLDLFLTNGLDRGGYRWGKDSGPYILYKNAGSDNHWIDIRLTGDGNKDPIGARVKLYIDDRLQYRQNNGGMEGYVQHGNPIHFGIGKATVIDKIEVDWPDGTITSMTNVKPDQFLVVKGK